MASFLEFFLLSRDDSNSTDPNNGTDTATPTATPTPVPVEPGSPALDRGGPFLPQTAQLGGMPVVRVDDPICAVLMFIFALGAVANMAIFQINRKMHHKFFFSALLFAFCLARIVSLAVRIVWANKPSSVEIALVANVITSAGVLFLFVINLVLAQRMLRAYHPAFGWHQGTNIAFIILYGSVAVIFVVVLIVTIQSFFTLDFGIRSIDRSIQLLCGSYLLFIAFLPIPILVFGTIFPRAYSIQKFGSGSFRMKLALVGGTAALLALGAGFRVGIAFDARPISQPAWFHSKACYYCFNYVIEIIVVFAYAANRFDRRFHVPDGSSEPGDYTSASAKERGLPSLPIGSGSSATVVNTRGRAGSTSGQSKNSVTSGKSSIKSSDKRKNLVNGEHHHNPTRDSAREWMEQAMRELYGEDHPFD
ncbi:hypothetical protein GQ53DRAFT_839773 [Thozetella sp. PMI_491]|nr:hypothetical protein GQ53DRAFT_839773 [Thozetella sp. PMI_491]